METIERVDIKRKIALVYADGSRKQNLGVRSAAEALKGLHRISVNAGPEADQLLNELAEEAHLRVIKIPEGLFLTDEVEEAKPEVFHLPATKTRSGLIQLSAHEVFTSVEKAMEAVRSWQPQAVPPKRYHQDLTETFKKGTAVGQIVSVFKDLKKYGAPAIQGKLRAFEQHANTSQDPLFRRYRAWLQHGYLPHHKETQTAPNRVDMDFFKFYALLELAKDA